MSKVISKKVNPRTSSSSSFSLVLKLFGNTLARDTPFRTPRFSLPGYSQEPYLMPW
jgi:hypothetical protein